MEALIEADGRQRREAVLGRLGHRHGDVVVGGFFHDLMVQDEAVRVFDHTDLEAQFHRHARLALADPFGVRLEDRKDLLGMGDGFAVQHPATDLVDLPFGMRQVAVQFGQP